MMAKAHPIPARTAGARCTPHLVAGLAALCLAFVAGCKPSLPRCDGGAAAAEEEKPGPRFLVVPQVRLEAFNLPATHYSPVNVTSELYFGGAPAGATIGYANLDGTSGFVMGASVLRYISAPRLFIKDGWVGTVALPDADGHIFFYAGDEDPVLVASFTTDLTGFRIAKCLSPAVCFHGALRGPTIGPAIMMMDRYEIEPNDEPLGAIVLGGSLDAGFAF